MPVTEPRPPHADITRKPIRLVKGWLRLVIAVVIALGLAAYCQLIFVPSFQQVAQQRGYDQGNLSDLYSRWVGTRALLQHGEDPYGRAVLAVSQRGFFGRDARPGEEIDEAAVFAHPVYLVFLLAPLSWLEFPLVQEIARWGFPLLVALGTVFWWAVIRPAATRLEYVLVAVAALCAPPTLEIGRVQQLSALTYFLLAGAVLLLARGHLVLAGMLLALSTNKPQESWGLVLLILIWALAALRTRRPVVLSFGTSMLILALAGEWVLPGWISAFVASSSRYMANTSALHLFGRFLPSAILVLLAVGWAGLLLIIAWTGRREAAATRRFLVGVGSTLALTQILLPTYLQYESIYLLPGLLLLLDLSAWYTGRIWFVLHRVAAGLLLFPWPAGATLGYAALIGVPLLSAPLGIRFLPLSLGPILPYAAVLALAPLLARRSFRSLLRAPLNERDAAPGDTDPAAGVWEAQES